MMKKQAYPIWIILVLAIVTRSISATFYKTKVVILGAGASGISAASTLHKKGQDDFIIVEGQSFIGGKMIYLCLVRM